MEHADRRGVASGRLPHEEIEVVNPATEEVVGASRAAPPPTSSWRSRPPKRAFPEWAATDTEKRAHILATRGRR